MTRKVGATCTRTDTKLGFTLVEILVVLAIVVVLAGLLLTVFSRARENGRRSSCQNNLRQIGLAIRQYVGDNDGVYPAAFEGSSTQQGLFWVQMVAPYAKNPKIFVCPSQTETPSYYYDYNANRLNTILTSFAQRSFRGKQESVLQAETSIIILEDTTLMPPNRVVELPASCQLTSPDGPVGAYSGSTIHGDGGNYAFADGHVKWLSPESRVAAECAAGSYDSSISTAVRRQNRDCRNAESALHGDHRRQRNRKRQRQPTRARTARFRRDWPGRADREAGGGSAIVETPIYRV